jgi:drug/metabolite transporter (DMT)-like permease
MHGLSAPVRFGFWMVVSCVCFGAIVGLVRYLAEDHGIDVWVIAFWRNLLSMVVFVPWFVRVGAGPALKSPHHGKLISRALLMNASSTAFYFAAVLMPVADATALSFTTPLFCVILATIFLRERVGPWAWPGWSSSCARAPRCSIRPPGCRCCRRCASAAC